MGDGSSSTGETLSADQVKYLSFQGGGAKGATYFGALTAFAESYVGIHIFKSVKTDPSKPSTSGDWALNTEQINGISGASAGAITATLVACGFTLREIYDFILGRSKYGSMTDLYDDAQPRKVPQVSTSPNKKDDDGCKPLDMPSWLSSSEDHFTNRLLTILGHDITFKTLVNLLGITEPKALVDKIKANAGDYAKNLILDYGFFSGASAWKVLDNMIADKARQKAKSSPKYGITFDQFSDIFEIDLVLTGTNLMNSTSQYFASSSHSRYSKHTTGSFKVIDALRISMSFPFAFKPVVIDKGDVSDKQLIGTWLDGGVLNNNPIHAFDKPDTVDLNSNMLGLCLGGGLSPLIENLENYVLALINTLQSPASAGQVRTPQEVAQTIVLQPGALNTLDFNPNRNDLSRTIYKANDTVLSYFHAIPSHSVIDQITGGALPPRGKELQSYQN